MSNGPRYRGKTFHEYMSAKFWHPASKRNIVTVWKRKQQMEADKRKADSRGEEARREHERNMVRAAMGDKKAKLGITWMYDMPNNIMPRDINAPENQGDRPGMTAKNFEIKFDWQKNAPRDSHFNDMGEVRNSIFNHKPFGIEVRNVKCLKCGEWGHSNFDRVCPLFGKVGDRDNPEFDIRAEEIEILASRLTENSSHGYKLKKSATQHVGDTIFDPMVKKQQKKGELELEYLKQLDPKEKAALLERLEKEQKKKRKVAKKKRSKAKIAFKKELENSMTKKQVVEETDDDATIIDDEPEEIIPEITNITMPKLKVDIEREERLAAKREFAYKLAEMQAMMAQSDSDSSDSDSSDSDSESDSDSDYETQKSSSTGSLSPTDITAEAKVEKVFKLPTNVKIAPAPKPGMVLVKRKRSRLDIEEENAKKLKTEKLKILEMTKLLRKKMMEKQKAEMAEQQKRLTAVKKKPLSAPSSSSHVTDDDLTSGLLDCLSKPKTPWKANPIIANYDSSSDED